MSSLRVVNSSVEEPGTSSEVETFCGYYDVQFEDDDYSVEISMLETPSSSSSSSSTSLTKFEIPKVPPFPPNHKMCRKRTSPHLVEGALSYSSVPMETKEIWDDLFSKGYGADVCIVAEDDKPYVMAHYHVLRSASPVLAAFIEQSRFTNGRRYIKIPGVSYAAVDAFIRFLYSSCYEEETMKEYVVHLLVLSHAYSVPSLKRVCSYYLEHGWLTQENVIDVLQLARECDSPRLSFVCFRMVLKDFKTISASEGWRVMRQSNPSLEQELLEAVVETDTRKKERLRKKEERKVYLQLYEAMEALIHICRDGCRTIGPRDKMLPKGGGGTLAACEFPACKGLEALVRHFSFCKVRIPGGCIQCKRMWQLLELHSRMCLEPDSCKVPLCRNLKEKMKKHSKKDEGKWRLLVTKLTAAKISLGPFSSKYSAVFIL